MSKGSNRIKTHPVLGPLDSLPAFEIFVDGQPVEAYEGDSIAAALLASGTAVLRYTASGMSPRGLFCGVGRCGDCFMQIDGVPARPTCTTPARTGQSIGVSSGLPAALRPDPDFSKDYSPEPPRLPGLVDLIVVGAGFAGAGVALAMAQSGKKVYLVDEKAEPFFNRKADLNILPAPPPELAAVLPELDRPGLYPFQVGALLQKRLEASDKITRLNRTAATGLFCSAGNHQLIITTETFSQKVVGRRIVLATGSYTQPSAFPGWTLPGVLLEQAALDLIHRFRVKLREPVLIGGSGPSARNLAGFMLLAGVETLGMVELEPSTAGKPVERFEVEPDRPFRYFEGYYLGRAEGGQQLQQAVLFPMDAKRDALKLEVGTLVLTGKETPLTELIAQTGVHLAPRPGPDRNLPYSSISNANQTGLAGVYLAGKAAGFVNQPDGWQTLWDGWQLGRKLSLD